MSWNSRPDMLKLADLSYVKNKLEYYAKQGFNSVWYLWGDISIHPKIIDIISYSKELWFKSINVITNWMLFSNYEYAYQIVDAWVTRINISIHSHISETEDYITKIPWWLERKLKAIKNFQKLQKDGTLKSNISINIVLNKLNLEKILDTVLFYYKKWINDIRINFIRLSDSDGLIKWWEELAISYTDFLPYLKKLIYISIKYNIRITFDTVPPCIFYKIGKKNTDSLVKRFLWEQFDIINQIDHVNIDDEKERFKWKYRRLNILKTKKKECKKCKYNDICEWVWKEYKQIYSLSEINPITN